MSSLFGGQINPVTIDPIVGTGSQTGLMNALQNAAGFNYNQGTNTSTMSGLPAFPGATSPNMSSTILPSVENAWQPMDAGTMFLASQLYNNGPLSNPNQTSAGPSGANGSPILTQMEQWGGTGGPGNQAESEQMQFGTPSRAGQYAANMAQSGVSSSGAGSGVSNLSNYGVSSNYAGSPLVGMAYGNSQLNNYLLPFMARATPYSAPTSYGAPKTGATL